MTPSLKYNQITTIFFITGIAVMCSLYTALPLTVAFAKDFDIPKSIATLNGVVFSITYSVSCLFYGTISEKFGRIRTILCGLVGLVIICCLIGFVRSFILLIILRALQGICAAAFSPVSITYVTENYSPVKRVTAISFISTSFMLSGVIGQNLSEIIVRYTHWHSVYFTLTILYLILAVAIYKKVPESPVYHPHIRLLSFFTNFKAFKTNKMVLLCYFVSLTLLTMFISMYDIFNAYITSDIVGGNQTTAINAKLYGIFGMLLALLAGRLSDRIGVKNVILTSLMISIISLLGMACTTNVTLLVMWSVMFIAGIAFCVPSVISNVGIVVNGNQGFFLSVNTFILFLGTALAPIINIYIARIQSFSPQFIIIACIGIISLCVALFLPKTKRY